MCLKTKESEFDSWQGQEIFPFSKVSRPVVGPTQPRLNAQKDNTFEKRETRRWEIKIKIYLKAYCTKPQIAV